MDILKESANAFNKLINYQYNIVIGRKGKTYNIKLKFNPMEYPHLIGLHKLRDTSLTRKDRAIIFNQIISEKITYKSIENSAYINHIKNRIEAFINIEKILDSNDLIFKYSKKLNPMSQIEANFLLCSNSDDKEVYLFIRESNINEEYLCCSFFPKEQIDYTRGQTKFTLLYKEKVNLITNEKEVQYNKNLIKDNL